jgi:hypothetical protein
MFELAFFAVLLVLLIGTLGLGYPESTHQRWTRH